MHVAVRALVKNPPEGGTFLGSPVEYFSVLESEIPDNRLHKSVVVKGLPKGVGDHVVIVYMDAISPVRCASVKIAGTLAVVEFHDYVGKWSRFYSALNLHVNKQPSVTYASVSTIA